MKRTSRAVREIDLKIVEIDAKMATVRARRDEIERLKKEMDDSVFQTHTLYCDRMALEAARKLLLEESP